MTTPEPIEFRAQDPGPELVRWSRGQAVAQLCAALVGAAVRAAWPVLPCALLSFVALLRLTRGAHTPSGRFGWANWVTLLRLAVLLSLTLPLPGHPWARHWVLPIVISVLALDLLDGHLARVRGDASLFGARFDMETDAQLVLVVTLHLWLVRGIGAWVLWAGLLRYLYVIWLWLWPGSGREAPRSRFGRYAFALLMIGLCGGLLLPAPLSSASALCGTLVVSWSFARSCYFSMLSKPAS
ncbi:MAG: CDP-alcohol phosphatidyltransferase family protein [Myxococcales bacterium]